MELGGSINEQTQIDNGRSKKVIVMTDRVQLNSITRTIIRASYAVSNTLQPGYLEKVRENALAYELKLMGVKVCQQFSVPVVYKDMIVGDYVCDLFVEGEVLVELKAATALNEFHYARCLNHLKASGLKVCLLINFGSHPMSIKRFVNRF